MTVKPPSFYLVDYLVSLSDDTLNTFCDTDDVWGRMIFLDALPVKIVGTGTRALTITNQIGAMYPGSDGAYGSAVAVRLYADHTRDGQGNAAVENGADLAWGMFGLLDQILSHTDPMRASDPFVQASRQSQPMEFFDLDQDLPYVAVTYDIAILVTA